MSGPSPERRRERRGFIIIAGLIAVVVLIVNASAVVDLFRDRYDLVVLLPEAGGVRTGTAVRVAGVEAGLVTRVHLLEVRQPLGGADTAGVAVRVRLDGDTRAVIRSDSPVEAGARRFIGEPLIRIHPGTPRGTPIQDGDTLVAVPSSTAGDILADAKTFPATLDSLMTSARELGAMVEARKGRLGVLESRITRALDELGALTADLEGGSLGRLMGDPALSARMASIGTTLEGLSAAVDTAAARYTGEDAELTVALDRLSTRSESLRSEIARLMTRLEEGQGMLGRMAKDSALAVAITGVQAQVDTLRSEAMSILKRMFLPGGD